MKLAIPSNDGLTLSPYFEQAKGFLILFLELGVIIKEEMRWNKFKENNFSADEFLTTINDCQAVIVNDIDPVFKNLLSGQMKQVIRTRESIITNAYVQYLENTLHKEANTCCCP